MIIDDFFILIQNKIFISFILTILISQISKLIIKFFKTKKLDFSIIFKDGGIPSGHSAIITAVTSSIYFTSGITNVFIISLVVATFIIHDAIGIRYQSQKHAILLNKMVKNSNLEESIGHTKIEAFAGIILGIIISSLVFFI